MPKVAAKVPDVKLLLIGGSREDRDRLTHAQGADRLKPVRMLGSVDEDDLLGAYAAAEVFAFPSMHESFGIVLLEAAAAGVPIVSRKVGVAEEIVTEGSTGFMGDFTSEDFAARIVDVLSSGVMRQNAERRRTEVLDAYDWNHVTDLHEQLYHECIESSLR
jgi:glycosyltransferase involved in cell wall biosynthesis